MLTAQPSQVRFDPRAVADVVREWQRSSRGAVVLLLRGLRRSEIQEFLRFSRRRMGRTIARFQRSYGELKPGRAKRVKVSLLEDLEEFVRSHSPHGTPPAAQPNPPGTATCSPWRARVGWCSSGGSRPWTQKPT